MNLSLWEWIKGPSVAMTAIMFQVIWTTAGTFMLMFIAALQDLPAEVEEAAMVDGANARQRFWNVTVPHLRPTILLVVTLGVIGTWQVFDQMYVMSQGKIVGEMDANSATQERIMSSILSVNKGA